MRRIVSVFAVFAVFASGAGAGLASDLPGQMQDLRRITVTGEGRVSAAPDMATITLGVTHADPEAQIAMAEVSARVAAMLDGLKSAGVAPEDLQTQRLTLGPLWSGRGSSGGADPEITGFSASNMVTARIRDLDALGRILDAVLQDGANGFQGLGFGLQDPAPLLDEARRAAVADAQARAALLAEAAGVTLGPVLRITDSVDAAQPHMRMEAAAMRSAPVPIEAGEVSLSATVTMVFAIGE